MMPNFDSPQAFLNYLRVYFAEYDSGQPRDSSFSKVTRARLEKVGIAWPPADPLHGVIQQIAANLLSCLSEEQRKLCIDHVACGSVRCHDFNARIIRSPEGLFALTLNEGLMLLLSKFSKYTLAAKQPESVMFCDQADPSKMTTADYRAMSSELFESYRRSGIATGPKIHLADDLDGQRAIMLQFAEAFIIGHEYGHFLNGDLSDDTHFRPLNDSLQLSSFGNEKNHAQEFKADAWGFRMMVRMGRKISSEIDAMGMLFPVLFAFDAIASISDRECYSHPAPIERLRKLTEDFFGEDAANGLIESYKTDEGVHQLATAMSKVSKDCVSAI